MVRRAKRYTSDVEFSAMDATRSDWSYVCEVLEAVIAAGATTVNIADTCGFAQPDEFAMLITYIREHVAGIEQATISVHCHDDLGLAVANSLAAIKAGARQVECCVNGIGERAGNASLEELAWRWPCGATTTRSSTGSTSKRSCRPASMLQRFTGVLVQPNKADRRRQRLRARERHSPGRHAQGRAHVRDHVRRRRRRRGHAASSWASTPVAMRCAIASRSSACC